MTVGSGGYRQQYIQLHCAVVREASIAMRLAAIRRRLDRWQLRTGNQHPRSAWTLVRRQVRLL